MNKEFIPNFEEKKIEYDFERGVEEVVRRIEEMLLRQDYVAIGIAGPSIGDHDVGKTFLKSKISVSLKEKGIPVLSTDHIDFIKDNIFSFELSQDYYQKRGKGVVILGALGFGYAKDGESKYNKALKDSEDRNLEIVCLESNLPISKIDLRILIYRPDQEEINNELADIVIKNSDAKIKNR